MPHGTQARMERCLESFLLGFPLAIWFGGGLAVLFSTRAIFRAAETRAQGGLFSGAVLASFSRLRWAAVGLTAIAWLLGLAVLITFQVAGPARFGGFELSNSAPLWAGAAAVLTAAQAILDRRIRALREQLGGSTEGLAKGDPRRKRWGALHGASVLLLLAQIACGGAGLIVVG